LRETTIKVQTVQTLLYRSVTRARAYVLILTHLHGLHSQENRGLFWDHVSQGALWGKIRSRFSSLNLAQRLTNVHSTSRSFADSVSIAEPGPLLTVVSMAGWERSAAAARNPAQSADDRMRAARHRPQIPDYPVPPSAVARCAWPAEMGDESRSSSVRLIAFE
jgi:hypothetical protein